MPDSIKDKREEPETAELDEDEREEPETADPDEEDKSEAEEQAGHVRKKHSAPSSGSAVRWLAAAALVVALGALGTTLWQLLRPTSTGSPAPTEQQIADAKSKACNAYATTSTALTLRSNADPGPDPNGVQAEAVSANARLAFAVGSSWLLSNLDPAAPAPLAEAIRKFANDSEGIAINALAGVNSDEPAQAARLKDVTALDGQITELCK